MMSTLIHELTHFCADEVFCNEGNPYRKDDVERKQLFESLAERLLGKINNMQNPRYQLIKDVFATRIDNGRIHSAYSNSEFHRELIVRMPQMICELGYDFVLFIPVMELFDYYKVYFIPELEKHLKKLENRVLGHLPKELVLENFGTEETRPRALRLAAKDQAVYFFASTIPEGKVGSKFKFIF